MSNAFYLHVHETCSKCNGCIYECEHRVKTTLTTTTPSNNGDTQLDIPENADSDTQPKSSIADDTQDDWLDRLMLRLADEVGDGRNFGDEARIDKAWSEFKSEVNHHTAKMVREIWARKVIPYTTIKGVDYVRLNWLLKEVRLTTNNEVPPHDDK